MYGGEKQKQKRQRMFVLWLLVAHAAVIAGQELSLDLYSHFFHTLSLFYSVVLKVSSLICHRTAGERPLPGFNTSIYRLLSDK